MSAKQVSPIEIENTIREHPSQFVTDVVVAGVKGGRLPTDLVPRAWVVLSNAGKAQGTDAVLAALNQWVQTRLSKHKWLRGGFQVVDEVSHNHRHVGRVNDAALAVHFRYRNYPLVKYCAGNCRKSMVEASAQRRSY